MQSNKNEELLKWKELSGGASVTHFTSSFSNQQIYLKKIKAHKKSENPLTIFFVS